MGGIPCTIRDAIVITLTRGIKYLWVDALCILQGSDEVSRNDWEVEYPKMADIYSRAYLTIVATLAPGVNHGILARRTDPVIPNVNQTSSHRRIQAAHLESWAKSL
jgi:hypothetical protein